MQWTTEAVRAEMDYRLETARKYNVPRRLREPRGPRSSWWRRVRGQHQGQYDQAA